MEESDYLMGQIESLQDLINEHKRVHGDGLFPSAVQREPQATTSARGRGGSTYFNSYNSRGRNYAPAPATEYAGSWRKTHFLRNKNPQSSTGCPSAPASSSSVVHSSIQPATRSISLHNSSRGDGGDKTKTAALSSGFAQQKKDGHTCNIAGIEKDPAKVESINGSYPRSSSTGPSSQHKQTGTTELPPSPLSKGAKQAPLATASLTSKAPATKSFEKKSKFTWVKSQNDGVLESKPGTSISPSVEQTVSVSPTSAPKAASASGSSSTIAKKTPAKKLPRKLSPAAAASKTSKYKWVSSSSTGAQAKTSQKSPETLLLLQRAHDTGEATKRLRGDRSHRGVRGGLFVSPSRASPPSSSPGGFKLRSRMKIIRKSANSGGGSERGSSPSAGKNFPQGRTHSSTRTPPGVRRTPSRDLVPFGRHKLRRLSPTSPRAGPASFSHSSPASQRVFKTRYNIVTRPGSSTSHAYHYSHSHTHSWKVKRAQAARSFHQSRPRSTQDRHPSPTQHWRGSDMCWIGDSLYRVSPNKLSRTVVSNISPTGRPCSPNVSPMTPTWNRPSSTRHLASRAVQRSLATIRQAHQKKQQKQYCMYYNRFGKCNRGDSCPYIHDPDKVAVCTRFLRGTCKQADGICPFSHQVAKEKMPVCSYFLKGICSNSDCPYSHVYVSYKAKVCEDFVKGYCPEGEKCKKKHTLLCPDFSKTGSCPNGSRCKLKHRHNAKRSSSSASSSHATKRARTEAPAATERPQADLVTPIHGPLTLPSFISLSCSPEEPETSDTQPAKVKAKGLQIKPRLKTSESGSSSSSSSSSGASGLS
ncbi:zinc finger CCCH domain-containing protein 3 isoform X1 [Solea solea]|uniref:zinc finger CCCH domain-containing protein 3 isoform X1 n=1 Tax=Solea solea TaxID=90069 RepID=UPI002729C4BB|nr:zinc finger CCCH domain-containing protein 3 isoform X1 [Solea solea]